MTGRASDSVGGGPAAKRPEKDAAVAGTTTPGATFTLRDARTRSTGNPGRYSQTSGSAVGRSGSGNLTTTVDPSDGGDLSSADGASVGVGFGRRDTARVSAPAHSSTTRVAA